MADDLRIRVVGARDELDAQAFVVVLRKTLLGLNSLPSRQRQRGWLVRHISMQSPASVLLSPRTAGGGEGAEWVAGLRVLEEQDGVSPPHWDARTIRAARDAVSVLAGQIRSLRFSANGTSCSPSLALVTHANRLLGEDIGPHRIKTTIEGNLEEISVHHRDKPTFAIYDLVSDARTLCVFDDDDLEEVKKLLKARVAVTGTAFYDDKHPKRIVVERLESLPSSRDLRISERLKKFDITSGEDSVDYVLRIRNGE